MHFSNEKTKSEAVLIAITDFNRRKSMAKLMIHAGSREALIS